MYTYIRVNYIYIYIFLDIYLTECIRCRDTTYPFWDYHIIPTSYSLPTLDIFTN